MEPHGIFLLVGIPMPVWIKGLDPFLTSFIYVLMFSAQGEDRKHPSKISWLCPPPSTSATQQLGLQEILSFFSLLLTHFQKSIEANSHWKIPGRYLSAAILSLDGTKLRVRGSWF